MKKAVLAGGCFWGVEELFRKHTGVMETRVGYTGGEKEFPTYKEVCTGTTGHAEAIEIVFDENQLSFTDLLRFFFKLHDPTTRNRQGNDMGSQYRSAIFYMDESQKSEAEAVIKEVDQSKKWERPIVTTLEPFKDFYLAEDYHQEYLKKNPGGYSCHFIRD